MTGQKRSLLFVCRMSPRLNGRARAMIESLEREYNITVVCERTHGMATPRVFTFAQLLEYKLAFEGRSLLHIAGAIRVLQMNLLGLIQAHRIKPDVVVCADVPYSFAGLILKLAHNTKFVFDAYEIIWGLGNGALFVRTFKWLERLILLHCDLWLVPSRQRAALVLRAQKLTLDYVTIPNLPAIGAVRTDEMQGLLLRAGVPTEAVTILFQGSLLPRRGLSELVEAAEMGSFHLIIQGDGPLRTWVETKAGSTVTILPPCPNDEAVSWLSAVNGSFVYYENDCLNSASACSSKFYASMIAGTPVVCNDLPAFRDFAEEFGACVIMDSLAPSEISRCIDALSTPRYRELKAEATRAGAALKTFPRTATLKRVFRTVLEDA
jgi:glycosyltransferase involved in cell wall biosynthesis